MNILYTSAECYPVAKVGGLADVVGALPKYLNKLGHEVTVVMPKYDLPWIKKNKGFSIYQGALDILEKSYTFEIEEVNPEILGFRLLLVDIPKLFFRKGVYSDAKSNYFADEAERYTAFDRAVLEWMMSLTVKPDVVHCHDHHTALIPFMMTKCLRYDLLKSIPTIFTIHNEKYRGRFSWKKSYLIPNFSPSDRGLLDWDDCIDPLACAVKCCWKMTTVSPSYMTQLLEEKSDLNVLFQNEKNKAIGLLNGIDNDYWDPKTDTLIKYHLKGNKDRFKKRNKEELCNELGLDTSKPLFSFIGRLAFEKGADLLPEALQNILSKRIDINIIILGTGMSSLEKELVSLGRMYKENLSIHILYDEGMAHQIYAGSDFLLMPSRVEPCGLNQMYALRFGTLPIVRSTGGLIDTVKDIRYKNGNGIRFSDASSKHIENGIIRGVKLYENIERFAIIREKAFAADFSWEASASNYIRLYKEVHQLSKTKKLN